MHALLIAAERGGCVVALFRKPDAVVIPQAKPFWQELGHSRSKDSFSSGALHVQRITSSRIFEALAPDWAELDAALSPRLPFTSPIWCLQWWKHYQRHSLMHNDRLNA